MILRIKYIRQILIIVLALICYQHEAVSQKSDSSKVKRPGLFIGFGSGPAQSDIINEGTLIVSKPQTFKQNSYVGYIEIGYFFSRGFGLSTGFELNSSGAQLTLGNYQNNYNTTDSENESYERRVTGSDIKEEQKVDFLSVPFIISLRIPFGRKVGFFLQPGVNVAFPLSTSYRSTGTFTYKGYYAADNVLFENLPAFGFPSNISVGSSGKLELTSYGFNAFASAGFDFFILKKIQIVAGAFYIKSLSDISNYSSPDNFNLTTDANQINSLMGGSRVSARSLGVRLSLRYYLR